MNISMYYDLKNWSIFSLLEPKFISNVRMAIVYGNIYFLYQFFCIILYLYNIICMAKKDFVHYFC